MRCRRGLLQPNDSLATLLVPAHVCISRKPEEFQAEDGNDLGKTKCVTKRCLYCRLQKSSGYDPFVNDGNQPGCCRLLQACGGAPRRRPSLDRWTSHLFDQTSLLLLVTPRPSLAWNSEGCHGPGRGWRSCEAPTSGRDLGQRVLTVWRPKNCSLHGPPRI